VIGQDVNIGAGTAAKPQAERDAVSAEIAAAEAAGYLPKIAQIISTVHVSPCHMAKVIPMVVVGGGGGGGGLGGGLQNLYFSMICEASQDNLGEFLG